MSWLYSQALVEEFSQATGSDGAPSAPSNTTPTPQAYLSPDRMTAFSRLSRFGMTFAPSTELDGVVEWMLSREDSRARTSAPPARAQASQEAGPASGPKWRELSVRYDRDSCSWRTHRTLFPEDLPWSSVTLPRWGMMRGGVCWERMMPEPRIEGSGSGSWATPQAHDAAKGNPDRVGRYGTKHGARNLNDEVALAAQVMWPTPTVSCATGGQASRSGSRKGELLLGGAVRTFPTPKSRDGKGQSQRGIHAQGDALPNMDDGTGHVVGGSLSPDWVEWLMFWPPGWTSLAPLDRAVYDEWERAGAEWWDTEHDLPRVAVGVPARAHRLRCIGNGQVPAAAVMAWEMLQD